MVGTAPCSQVLDVPPPAHDDRNDFGSFLGMGAARVLGAWLGPTGGGWLPDEASFCTRKTWQASMYAA